MSSPSYQPVSISGMIRGVRGMISYYLMIGILLGVFAACCGGPLAFFHWLDERDGSSQNSPDQKAPIRPDQNTPDWMRSYVGDYSRHGQSLKIDTKGDGLYRSRTYQPCNGRNDTDPLCEPEIGDMPMRVQFTLVQAGGEVWARVDSSNSAGHNGHMPISIFQPGILTFDGMEFCEGTVVSPEDNQNTCGA